MGGWQCGELLPSLVEPDAGTLERPDLRREDDLVLDLGDVDLFDPGVVVEARPLEHAEQRPSRPGVEDELSGQGRALAHHLDATEVEVVTEEHELHDPATPTSPRVRNDVPARTHRRAEGLECRVAHAVGDRARLCEPVEHRVDDVVDTARADRVVRGVADHLAPGELEERPRPVRGRDEQCVERLGPPFEGMFDPRSRTLHVDAVGGDAH
jgi:hypothetical protein